MSKVILKWCKTNMFIYIPMCEDNLITSEWIEELETTKSVFTNVEIEEWKFNLSYKKEIKIEGTFNSSVSAFKLWGEYPNKDHVWVWLIS